MNKCLMLSVLLAACNTVMRAADKPAVEGAVPGQWTMDFEAARKVAADKKLPLFLNFTGSDWCGWCKLMDKQVFATEAWKTYAAQSLVLVWIDFPKDKSLVPEKFAARNKALAELFGVQGYPTYIVLDDNGKDQLGQLSAERDITPDTFVAKLRDVLKERKTETEALLKSMPEKTAKEFRDTIQKRDAAREELKALEANFEKRGAELKELIDRLDARQNELRIATRLDALPKPTADAYRAKQQKHKTVKAELDAWLATDPPRSDENMKKFNGWKAELATLEKELGALLETK